MICVISNVPDVGRDLLYTLSDAIEMFGEDRIVDALGDAMGAANEKGWGNVPPAAGYFVFAAPSKRGVEPAFMWDCDDKTYVVYPQDKELMEGLVNTIVSKIEAKVETRSMSGSVKPSGQGWRMSSKGNLTAKIRGFSCTVFRSRQGPGYCGIISGNKDEKVFTETCPTEDEVVADIEANFEAYLERMK
jgi:hypothetical protein